MSHLKRTLRECCGQDALRAGDGTLTGVKVLGERSANGRRYTPESMRRGLSLYEGAKVNIDHPAKSEEPRSLNDRFGKLVNARLKGAEVFADLVFNPHHPMAESVQWWAENSPDCLGMSHNAIGQGHTEDDGVFVVEQILAVRSVDLVADPATTNGLFESRGRRPPLARAPGRLAHSGLTRADLQAARAVVEAYRRRDRLRQMTEDELAVLMLSGEYPHECRVSDEQVLAKLRGGTALRGSGLMGKKRTLTNEEFLAAIRR